MAAVAGLRQGPRLVKYQYKHDYTLRGVHTPNRLRLIEGEARQYLMSGNNQSTDFVIPRGRLSKHYSQNEFYRQYTLVVVVVVVVAAVRCLVVLISRPSDRVDKLLFIILNNIRIRQTVVNETGTPGRAL